MQDMEQLQEELDHEEHGNSIFETSIRTLHVPACTEFLQGTQITPIRFKQVQRQITSNDSSAIARQYPKLMAANWDHVLEYERSDEKSSEPKSGKRVAVLFSGGPAAGGHNAIAGIKQLLGKEHTLLGVRGGPKGLLAGQFIDITDADIASVINTGGFDLLGTDRTKIKTQEQLIQLKQVCITHSIDAIIIIGGDDSNTNAAIMGEYLFTGVHAPTKGVQVIGVPKTMDGDVQQRELLPISFGFSTATRIYAEQVGNILQDTPSSRKYWHFIKLMGRTASHVALEVALQTRPPIALISEEVAARKQSLHSIVDMIAQAVIARSHKGLEYGVVLVPEGLLEFVPEFTTLIEDLNAVHSAQHQALALLDTATRRSFVAELITKEHKILFNSLPHYIQSILVADRDAHGNLPVSQIPTERLLIDMVSARLLELHADVKFATNSHFFGYEGRCGAPTSFDAMFAYNLGLTAASLVLDERTGYMAAITDFDKGGRPLAIPLTGILTIEIREGKQEFVIQKALVKLDDPAFVYFAGHRDKWCEKDCFSSPGPRQLWGPTAEQMPMIVALNQDYPSIMYKREV